MCEFSITGTSDCKTLSLCISISVLFVTLSGFTARRRKIPSAAPVRQSWLRLWILWYAHLHLSFHTLQKKCSSICLITKVSDVLFDLCNPETLLVS